jgi:ADP-heptose:LPS heptosyltransferase
MHIAAALNVPVVAVTGVVNIADSPAAWGPWCEEYTIVHKDPGCLHCQPADCGTLNCLDLITVEDVMSAVKTYLKEPKEKS